MNRQSFMMCVVMCLGWIGTVSAANDGMMNETVNVNFATPQPTVVPPMMQVVNWSGLCPLGQQLIDDGGCSPDCGQRPALPVCNQLFQSAHIEQITGIPRPYLPSAIVFFQLVQKSNTGSTAVFNITLNQKPTDYGYRCEILNSDGTPAILWTKTSPPVPMNVLTLDNNLIGPPFQSVDLVTTVAEPLGSIFYWYNNANNPLYMVCLGYNVIGQNYLQSAPGCGGVGPTCVAYTLQ